MKTIEPIQSITPAQITRDVMEVIRQAAKSIDTVLVGRAVRVMSDHNGQPFGRSRKSWRGEVRRIKAVHIDVRGGIEICLEGHEFGECFIGADEVEFV